MNEGWSFGSGSFGADSDSDTDRQNFTRFAVYDINVDLRATLGQRKLVEFSMLDLRQAIQASPQRRNVWAETEIARRWASAGAVLPFAIIGMILGLTRVRGGRSERLVLGVLIFFLYHVASRSVQAMAQAGVIHPYFALSLPNLLFGSVAIILFHFSALDLEAPGHALVVAIFSWTQAQLKQLEL
jgi:lipopolysaccharide export LptBFGC system permease protein LptF